MDLVALLNLGRPDVEPAREDPEKTADERVREQGADVIEREASAHAADKDETEAR